jgi:hypothetical protein
MIGARRASKGVRRTIPLLARRASIHSIPQFTGHLIGFCVVGHAGSAVSREFSQRSKCILTNVQKYTTIQKLHCRLSGRSTIRMTSRRRIRCKGRCVARSRCACTERVEARRLRHGLKTLPNPDNSCSKLCGGILSSSITPDGARTFCVSANSQNPEESAPRRAH